MGSIFSFSFGHIRLFVTHTHTHPLKLPTYTRIIIFTAASSTTYRVLMPRFCCTTNKGAHTALEQRSCCFTLYQRTTVPGMSQGEPGGIARWKEKDVKECVQLQRFISHTHTLIRREMHPQSSPEMQFEFTFFFPFRHNQPSTQCTTPAVQHTALFLHECTQQANAQPSTAG